MPGETNEVNWRGVRPVSGIRGIWPARDAVRINAEGWIIVAGTAVVYTVPAGKILFIASAYLTTRFTVEALEGGHSSVRNGADVHQYRLNRHDHFVPGQLVSSQNFSPALEAAADWDVIVTSTHNNLRVAALIFGWIEDA